MKVRKIILSVFCLLSLMFVLTSCGGFSRQTYEVTFDSNGGTTVESQNVEHDKKVTRPEVNPTKEGYTFVDWFSDESLTAVYDFNSRVRKSFTIYAKWNINTYKLDYATNVEDYTIKGTKLQYASVIKAPEVDEEKFFVTGSTFGGWYLDAEYSIKLTEDSKMPAKDTTLYAKWIKNDHKVSIFVDDIEKDPVLVKYGDKFADFKSRITVPTKTGFDFDNWYLNINDANPIADDYVITKDIELHAKWKAKSFTLNFDSKGGSEIASQNYPFNSAITAPKAPTKIGYTFAGWYVGENLFDFTSQKMPANDLTLEAKWLANSYTVQYFVNGGTGTLEDSKLTISDELTLPTNTFTKIGYTFVGWNTKADGSGASYTDGGKISLNSTNPENIKLYAQWEANNYTVKFDANIGDVTAPANINATYDANITLPVALEKIGYNFLGWNTKADGSGTNYAAGQTVKNLSTNEDITLYAKWEHVEYTLTINIQNNLTEIKLHYGEAIPAQANPEIDGYDFDGWFAFINEEWVAFSFENAKMPNNDLIIAAKFLGEVTITFISNGSVHDTLTGFEGNELTDSVEEPTRIGYTFAGWFTEPTFENAYTLPTSYPKEGYNVYAKWNINKYTVTFNYDNGSDNDEVELDFGSKLTEPTEPTKEGYSFGGWLYGESAVVFSTFTVPAEDIEIKVEWNINKYTIEFDSDGGNAVASINENFGTELTAPTNPTKTGYKFLGWFEEGSNTAYSFTTMPARNLTLVAKWEAQSFTLTINLSQNGVSETPITSTIKYDQFVKDILSYSLREGYTFSGWFTSDDLNDKNKFVYNESTIVEGDITLYANYQIDIYTVEFISEGRVIYSTTKQYKEAVSFNHYVESIKTYNTAYGTLKQAILGVIGGQVGMDTLMSVINGYRTIYETDTNLKGYIDAMPSGDSNLLQQFYSYVSSLYDTSQSLVNMYEANKSGEDYFPSRNGYFFGGWFLGADTELDGKGQGTEFTGFTPASSIGAKTVKIVALWEKLGAVSDLAADKDNANTIIWTQIDPDLLKPGEKETLAIKYLIYNKNTDNTLTLLDSIAHDHSLDNLEQKITSYTFMTKDTFSAPGHYNLVVVALAEISNEKNEIVRSYESEVSDALEYTLIINPGEVTVETSGDYYHKDGSTFYFFTNVDYDFPDTNNFTLVEITEGSSSLVTVNGSLITTTAQTGTFKFTNTVTGNEGELITTEYLGNILPYVSQFTLGKDLSIIAESNANNSMFRGKNAKYTIGRAYEDLSDEDNDFIKYEKLFEYKNNGFRFDLNVLTSGGKNIDVLGFVNYLTYTFYTKDGTLVDNDSMGEYNKLTDSWAFTAAPGEYKVEININPLFVPKKLVDDEIIKPVTFEFVLDNSINVYTHEQFKAIFANTNIGESLRNDGRVRRGISLHSNIEAKLDDNQYYDTTNQNHPLIAAANNASLAGHTPISSQQDDAWVACANGKNPYGSVYYRFSTELNEDYVINGNCFEIQGENLPFVSIYAEANLSTVTGYEIASVHIALIHYMVTSSIDNDTSNSNLHINNLKLLGNTKKYNSEADGSTVAAMNRNSGGYLGVAVSFGCNLFIDNSIVQNTTVALNPNNESGLTVSNTVVKNSFSNTIYAFDNGDINVINCHFEDAGGAAIHLEDTESYMDKNGNEFPTDNVINIDTLTKISNYVSGDEGFFKSRSFEILITGMKAQFQAGANANGMTMIEKITDSSTGLETEKINLIMLLVPRGDNSRVDGPWDLDANGNKNYHSGGFYQGMYHNMNRFTLTSTTESVTAMVRGVIEQQVRANPDLAGAPEETIQAVIEQQMQTELAQGMIQGTLAANPTPLTSLGLSAYDNATTVIPLTLDPTKNNNLGYGYMLTGYDIPTFGYSMIVTGVQGLDK